MTPQRYVCTALAVVAFSATGLAVAQQSRAPAPTPHPATSTQPDLRAEPVPPAIDAAFHKMDVDHNGTLSLSEFRNGWRRMHHRKGRRTAMRGLRAQFKRLDTNNNGGIDRTEYPNMMLVKKAGPQALPFSQVDRDNNQKLDFAEYTSVVRRLSTLSAKPREQHK